ncbi:MAG: hypothetical protein GY861_22250 [bacterium]|nr:hypothetical protein [bacterium]
MLDTLEERLEYYKAVGQKIHPCKSLKISEMISVLNGYMKKHGDLEVYYTNHEFNEAVNIIEDSFSIEEDSFTSRWGDNGVDHIPRRLQIR